MILENPEVVLGGQDAVRPYQAFNLESQRVERRKKDQAERAEEQPARPQVAWPAGLLGTKDTAKHGFDVESHSTPILQATRDNPAPAFSGSGEYAN